MLTGKQNENEERKKNDILWKNVSKTRKYSKRQEIEWKANLCKKKNKVLNNFLCKRKILKKLYFILFCLVLSFFKFILIYRKVMSFFHFCGANKMSFIRKTLLSGSFRKNRHRYLTQVFILKLNFQSQIGIWWPRRWYL